MKIYLASHDQSAAKQLSRRLKEAGYRVVSSWVDREFKPFNKWTFEEASREAMLDLKEVDDTDILVLLSGEEKYSGGKFVETGYALGRGKRVIIVGRRENLVLADPRFEVFPSIEDFVCCFCPDTDHVYGA